MLYVLAFLCLLNVTPIFGTGQCAEKMFDGRPKEWRTGDGKGIAAYGGYWTLFQCKSKCAETPGCQELRIKKGKHVPYSGCVLMKAGTTYSGQYTSSFEMYRLAAICAEKMFDGRPKEWRTDDGKVIAGYGGYWTFFQCKSKCAETPGCQEFRIKKGKNVLYSGCVLMKAGKTYSGQYTSSFEMYKLINKCSLLYV